jgi:hypothetical protein
MLTIAVSTAAKNFMSRTNAPDFNATQALEMFQRRYTIDYGRKASRSRAANPEDKYFPIFHLDMIGIVSRPLRPITSRSGFFDNVTFTLRYWHSSYADKHVSTNCLSIFVTEPSELRLRHPVKSGSS